MIHKTLATIQNILAEKFGVGKEQSLPSASLFEDLNLSHLEISDLLAEIAKTFDFEIPEGVAVEQFSSVEDLVQLVEQYCDE